MVIREEGPEPESSKRSWSSGAWGRESESGSNKAKSRYSPRRILSSVLFSRALWKPSSVATPDLRCCGPVDAEGKEEGKGWTVSGTTWERWLYMASATDCWTVRWMAASCPAVNGAWLSGMTDCSTGSTSDGISKSSSELTDEESSVTSATSSAIGSNCATEGCSTRGLPLSLPFRTRPACFLNSAKGLWVGWEAFCRRLTSCALLPVIGRLSAWRRRRRTSEVSEARFSLFSGRRGRRLRAWGFSAPRGRAIVTILRAN